jgi:YaiO family outer membrane protein
MYVSPRLTPFVFASTQARDVAAAPGSQQSYGAGSYVTFTPRLSALVSASAAPGSDVELYPRRRLDATLIAGVPGVTGLLWTGGITDIRFAHDAGGRIISTGPILYLGRGIYSAVARFNRDRLSGAQSHSFLAAGQYGAQGSYWVGGSLGGGNEAYQVLAATPFDARFESRGASAFLQKWVTRRQGFTARYDFEHKLKTYHRNGVAASYFVEW